MCVVIVFIICCYGISNMLVYAEGPFHIFDAYRWIMNQLPSNLGHGSECMICTPTWIGMLMGYFVFSPACYCFGVSEPNIWETISYIICDGALASGSSWLIHTAQETFESITNVNQVEENE